MNAFDAFMDDVIAFSALELPERAAEIRGHSEATIAALEARSRRRLPGALRSFAARLGADTGALEFTLGIKDLLDDGLREASELAQRIATSSPVSFPKDALFFAALTDDGEGQCWYLVNASGDDDPPVGMAGNGFGTTSAPRIVAPTFTAWVRDMILGNVEWSLSHKAFMSSAPECPPGARTELEELRLAYTVATARADAARGRITPILEFQARWVDELSKTRLYADLMRAGVRVPYGWRAPPWSAPPDAPGVALNTTWFKHHERCSEVRRAFWSRVGEVDDQVLVPAVNPEFKGHDPWPGMRPEWLVTHAGARTYVASNGLSDPFDEDRWSGRTNFDELRDLQGLGVEIFACADDPGALHGWLTELVIEASLLLSDNWSFVGFLREHGYGTASVVVPRAPARWLAKDRSLGVMIGVPVAGVAPSITMPRGEVLLVSVIPLTPRETEVAARGGRAARAIHGELARLPGAGVASFTRAELPV